GDSSYARARGARGADRAALLVAAADAGVPAHQDARGYVIDASGVARDLNVLGIEFGGGSSSYVSALGARGADRAALLDAAADADVPAHQDARGYVINASGVAHELNVLGIEFGGGSSSYVSALGARGADRAALLDAAA